MFRSLPLMQINQNQCQIWLKTSMVLYNQNEAACFKNVNICWITKIIFYLEILSGRNSNLYLKLFILTPVLIRHLWQLKTLVFLHWRLICSVIFNEGESAASFCRQATAWVPDMFCNCYLVKNHKITNNSGTTEAREK